MDIYSNCEYNAGFYKACISFSGWLYDIFQSKAPHIIIKNLRNGKVLNDRFPEIYAMVNIYQDKKSNHSLFDHSLKALQYTHEELGSRAFPPVLMAAFFHDYGKVFTTGNKFKDHDRIGPIKTELLLSSYKIPAETIKDAKKIMQTHFYASQYQREPNWSNDAVIRFIRKSHPFTLEAIAVAKADKMASHNYGPYLVPYDELRKRCLDIFKIGVEV